MREIKFRAWNGREMYPLSQITFPGGGGWSVEKGHGVSLEFQPHVTVMQFTGLHDKNGKEIYDGDVVRYGSVRHEISFRDGGFQFANVTRDTMALGLKSERVEIIGNIYENPELISE